MSFPMVALEEVLTERKEVPSADDLATGKIRIVAKVGFNDGEIRVREDGQTKTGMILIRPGDLVVSGINAAKGAIAVYKEEYTNPIAATIHYGAYIPNKDRVDIKFLWWLLRSRIFRAILLEYVPGGIKTELKAKRLLPVPIPLPPLAEQLRIVARIEKLAAKIEEARRLRRQTAEEIEAIIKSQMNQFFGCPYTNKSGNLRISNFASLNDVVIDVADGPHVTPTYVENGIPFVTAQNVTSGRVNFSGLKYITLDDHKQFQKRAKVEKGDVLISKDGTIGFPCFVDTDIEFSFFVSVALIKPKRDILDGEFLTWILRTPYLQERIRKQSRGDMIRHLVLREIRDLIVPIPPLPEQRRIVAYLDELQAKVDALKRLQAETGAELDALMPAVLDRAFKGEL